MFRLAAASRQASRCVCGGGRRGRDSSLQPALAASAPWRGCSVRTQSYASQLAAAEAGTGRDGRRSTGDRQRARGSRFFLQKTPACWRAGASAMPPPSPPRRLALFLAVRPGPKWQILRGIRRTPPLVQHLLRACSGQTSPLILLSHADFDGSLTTMELPCLDSKTGIDCERVDEDEARRENQRGVATRPDRRRRGATGRIRALSQRQPPQTDSCSNKPKGRDLSMKRVGHPLSSTGVSREVGKAWTS